MHRFFPATILAFTLSMPAFGQSPVVQTFAGGGLPQGVRGTTVNLGQPTNLAADAAGNVYIPVLDYHVVLRLDTAGRLTVVAGNGTRGYSGDGGPATSAQLSGPLGVAVDSAGSNVYIADTGNHVIRKISNGNITTIAGTGGTHGYGGDGGPATAALLNSPSAVAVDGAGIVYIADQMNNRVRKVSSGQIVLFAGDGIPGFTGDNGSAQAAELNAPFSIAADHTGNVYISDTNNHRIRRVFNGGILTVAGNGNKGFAGDNGGAAIAQLNFPSGIALDASGNLYIADRGNARVRLVTTATHIITTFAGTGVAGFGGDGLQASAAQLASPVGVTVNSSGNVYIADRGQYITNGRIRKVATGGVITTVAGTGGSGPGGDGGLATNAQLNAPKGVALDAAGNIYIADTNDNRIREVTRTLMTPLAGTGIPGYGGDNGSAAAALLHLPTNVAVDPTGVVYVADAPNNVVRKISNGTITAFAGTGVAGLNLVSGNATTIELNQPSGVAVDSAGAVYIADTGNGRIRKVSGGVLTTIAGGGLPSFGLNNGPALGAYLNAPTALAVDGAGDIYVADTGNNLVRKIVGSSIDTVAGTGLNGFGGDGGPATSALLSGPSGVAVDPAGNVYIADTNNQRIREVTATNGLIVTIAGTGIAGFAGDGGPATKAQFSAPAGIAVDPTGSTIYVADTGNHRVRVVGPPGGACIFTLSATSLQPSAAGGSFSVDIQTGSFCSWTMTGLPSWITVTGGSTSGSGPSTVTLTVASNSGDSRSATITVKSATLSVNQQASNGCSYTLSPGGQGFSAAGGTGSIAITTAATCAWSVSGAPSWITITGAGSGSGNGAVAFRVSANSGAARSATLSFPGLTFLVDQAAISTIGFTSIGSMAHTVTGGGWTTTLWLVNPSLTLPVQLRLNLFDDNGNPLSASLNFPQNPSQAAPEIASTIDRRLAPDALLIVDIVPTGTQSTVEGWVQVLSDATVGGSATFRFTVGSLDHQALVPIESRSAAAYLVPFDNTGGFVAGIALANTVVQAGSVGVTIRDDTGAKLLATTRPLAGFGHTAFVLPTDYPVAAGKRGTVEFDIPLGGQISVLGIQYNNASGGFSTIPALVKQ